MAVRSDQDSIAESSRVRSNAEIATGWPASPSQFVPKGKSYKIKAYQRAATRIRNMSETLDGMVREARNPAAIMYLGNTGQPSHTQ